MQLHEMPEAARAPVGVNTSRGRAPVTEGSSPRTSIVRPGVSRSIGSILLGAVAFAAMLSSGCSQTNETRTRGPYTLAITDTTPAAIPAMGDNDGLYEVQTSVTLPLIDRPKDLPIDKVKPYPNKLWYTSASLQMQLTYVITNLSDAEFDIELLVDGFNEFVRYSPMTHLDDEGNLVEDYSMVVRRITMHPRERVTGTVSYDDFERMALALAIIMNGAPNPFHVVETHTDLQNDPLTKPFLPSQVDGLTGFDLSLRARSANKIAVEATVELIDHEGLLVPSGEEATSTNKPPSTLYHPVVATDPGS